MLTQKRSNLKENTIASNACLCLPSLNALFGIIDGENKQIERGGADREEGRESEKGREEREQEKKKSLCKLWEHSETDAGTHKLYASFAYSWHKTLCK